MPPICVIMVFTEIMRFKNANPVHSVYTKNTQFKNAIYVILIIVFYTKFTQFKNAIYVILIIV